ncbi:MAG: carboxypeptidase regulatory-like domain-containing protein, partial [Flavobacteriales bacterium]|nr:carboxypeptidase regulatory-like domain-containing protein [Flavobacteriales bacterium]
MLKTRLLWTVLAVCLSTLLFGQVDNVYVYGTVKDYISAKKLDGVTVSVFKNGQKLAETTTNASGKYEFNLDYGSDYKIVYGKGGMVAKNITIDTRNIPEEERVGGHGMNVEMTLFNELP